MWLRWYKAIKPSLFYRVDGSFEERIVDFIRQRWPVDGAEATERAHVEALWQLLRREAERS